MTPEPANPDSSSSAPWVGRKKAAEKALEELVLGSGNPKWVYALREYASDPKWEVRKVVAEALAVLPDDLYSELVTALHGDNNAFVRAAAVRSVERRTPVSRITEGVPGKIQQAYDKIVWKHGPEAAQNAVEFAHTVTERHLRTGFMTSRTSSLISVWMLMRSEKRHQRRNGSWSVMNGVAPT